MHRLTSCVAIVSCACCAWSGDMLLAQTFTTSDPILEQIWEEGMARSQAMSLAQSLMDSVGPRLTGTPNQRAGNQWLLDSYAAFGIEARREEYGTWRHWSRGRLHVDLMEPRVRTLEAIQLAWTPGTGGETRRGPALVLPEFADAAAFERWLPSVAGAFVAISFPEPTCRPNSQWNEFATEASYTRMREDRDAARQAWADNLAAAGFDASGRRNLFILAQRLEEAGALGVLTSTWPGGWGVQRVFNGGTERVPTVALSCEDFGLVSRLAAEGQRPVLEVMSDAEIQGEGPVFNVIAEVRGSELPDEYVMLSAHFDSWDAASGATDNGTGTITMLEAMRILRRVYPNPRRTILVGHWSGEEQGLNGSRAFAADHPEVVEGLQALFNQDNGTGRVVNMSASGFPDATGPLARWLARVPREISTHIRFGFTGNPASGGSDHAAFVCYGAPGFSLGALNWEYSPYTWHTNRDTYDKIVADDLMNNATLTAMLVYLASEEPQRLNRDRRTVFGRNPFSGQVGSWPECQPARRSYDERRR